MSWFSKDAKPGDKIESGDDWQPWFAIVSEECFSKQQDS